MKAGLRLFEIGQTVRLLPDQRLSPGAADIYTIMRCNEPDSANPSYVIRSEIDSRQRREHHDRLRPVAQGGDGAFSTVQSGGSA